MFHIDFEDSLKDYLLDEKRKISENKLNFVCKIYQKEKTCRYLALSQIGYVCMKNSPAKEKLDFLVKNNQLVAKGNNCRGIGKNAKKNIDK